MPVDRVVRLAARGDGVAESGRHVPMTAPGDSVADDGAVIPGPHHAVPPCRHFPECGGCQLQHVDDSAYAQYLIDRIASALAAQDVAVPAILSPHLSPPNSRRRASLRALNTAQGVLIVGLLSVLTGALYPAVVTALAQALFPHRANGSLVVRDGRVVGSELIGQPFRGAGYFWSRPSATVCQRSAGVSGTVSTIRYSAVLPSLSRISTDLIAFGIPGLRCF